MHFRSAPLLQTNYRRGCTSSFSDTHWTFHGRHIFWLALLQSLYPQQLFHDLSVSLSAKKLPADPEGNSLANLDEIWQTDRTILCCSRPAPTSISIWVKLISKVHESVKRQLNEIVVAPAEKWLMKEELLKRWQKTDREREDWIFNDNEFQRMHTLMCLRKLPQTLPLFNERQFISRMGSTYQTLRLLELSINQTITYFIWHSNTMTQKHTQCNRNTNTNM